MALVGVVACSACVPSGYLAHRHLHYVDDTLVESEAPPPLAYEAYLRARLALERDPPDLMAARAHILDALRWQPKAPQLWTVRAEIEWRDGQLDAAREALDVALALRPGYPEAQRLLARLSDPTRALAAKPNDAQAVK